jgi:hypothetical protein
MSAQLVAGTEFRRRKIVSSSAWVQGPEVLIAPPRVFLGVLVPGDGVRARFLGGILVVTGRRREERVVFASLSGFLMKFFVKVVVDPRAPGSKEKETTASPGTIQEEEANMSITEKRRPERYRG